MDNFWYSWSNLPHSDPSKIFCERGQHQTIVKKVGNDKTIEAIAVFEEGITPIWEDPINTIGVDFSVKLGKINLEMVA